MPKTWKTWWPAGHSIAPSLSADSSWRGGLRNRCAPCLALCRAHSAHAIGWCGRPRGLRGGARRVPCDPGARQRVDDVWSPHSCSQNSSHSNGVRVYHAIRWTLDAPRLSTVIVLRARLHAHSVTASQGPQLSSFGHGARLGLVSHVKRAVSEIQVGESRMVLRTAPQGPAVLALGFLDRQVIDAGQ